MDKIFKNLNQLANGIYTYDFNIAVDQKDEILLRKEVAENSVNYWQEITQSHSIPVMDREVELFLSKIPFNGTILDVGGGYGWHWRNLPSLRPDIKVVILDFSKETLAHARIILEDNIDNIYLVEGDAKDLIFDNASFDGYWSVQALQHIPDFERVIDEAYRTIKQGGVFANYSLNKQLAVRIIYRMLGKRYHHEDGYSGRFYLSKASNKQFDYVKKIFGDDTYKRYSEVIFEPGLKFTSPGKEGSLIGKLDSLLSAEHKMFSSIARQQSFHAVKTDN
jgi:ubiquinone/menaquinone biosynthesis C-methylase UbiE